MNKNRVHASLGLWIILMSHGAAIEAWCPEGFFHHGSSCYFFSANLESDWIEAGFFCNRFHGGDLVSIDSQSENSYLYTILNLMKSQLLQLQSSFELKRLSGLVDEFVEGHWIWISTMRTMTFTDWPEGSTHRNSSFEDCLQIHPGSNGHSAYWQAAHCNTKTNFICEVPVQDGSQVVG